MNNYNLIKYHESKKKPKLLTKKAMEEIEKRQLYALRYNNYMDIVDAKQQVLQIIDKKGLQSDDEKTSLDTAIKILPYIMPQKKAIEMNVITRKLEDIIEEAIEEAQIIDEKQGKTPEDDKQ